MRILNFIKNNVKFKIWKNIKLLKIKQEKD